VTVKVLFQGRSWRRSSRFSVILDLLLKILVTMQVTIHFPVPKLQGKYIYIYIYTHTHIYIYAPFSYNIVTHIIISSSFRWEKGFESDEWRFFLCKLQQKRTLSDAMIKQKGQLLLKHFILFQPAATTVSVLFCYIINYKV